MPADCPPDVVDTTVRAFIAATAAKTPTPGGGSVGGVTGALAAALGEMSMQYTLGKKQFAARRPAIEQAIAQFARAREVMIELIAEDIAAYELLSGFLKLPREQREGDGDYLAAVVAAIRAPQTLAAVALHVLEQCVALSDTCNPYLLSDLAAAAALAYATVHVGAGNVLVNAKLLPNPQEVEDTRRRIDGLTAKADAIWSSLRPSLRAKL